MDDRLIEESVRKIPVQMTAREQSILASLCEAVGSLTRDEENGVDYSADGVVDRLLTIALTFEATATEFGKLYEKLHRTGANA